MKKKCGFPVPQNTELNLATVAKFRSVWPTGKTHFFHTKPLQEKL
jgi:hypothetical protein